MTVYNLNFRILGDARKNPEKLRWSTTDEFMIVHSTEKRENFLKIYLDDILSIKDSEEVPESLEIIFYPLVNSRRERQRGAIFGENFLNFGIELKLRLKPPIPPHLPMKLKNRKILVLINPFSGQKKALNLYNTFCRPVFLDAGIECEIRYTKSQNHGTEIVQNLDIDNYESIAIVSGDGLVNEVITGLLIRGDRERALKFPILHIPGGTANALAASVAFKSGEPFSPRGGFCKEMTLMGSRPVFRKLRLNHFEGEKEGHKCMFLSAVWGLFADIDICSERFRWAGMIRLHMEAFIRIMQLPTVAKYKGTVSYLPINDDEIIRKTRLRWNEARKKFGKKHFAGGHVDEIVNPDLFSELKSKRISIEKSFENQAVTKMTSLRDPVPSDWITVSGEFVYVMVSSASHLGSDLPYMPMTKLEEEILYLTIIDWKVVQNRIQVAGMFVEMDHCAHLDYRCFQVIPVLACRIEPEPGTGGCVAVDGEPCTRGSSFQAVSTNLCATVVSRQLRD
ncbi:hypothetical protein FO519_005307 [Halicephalobus sp. NKZ332]|nr:hypothetical protein FO519_005307 [Halicephalobus sp. NKZ332]